MKISDIRHENLERLIEEFGTQDEVANLGTTSPVYISQIRNKALDSKTGRPREMGNIVARKLETGCKKPVGWMDVQHGTANISSDAAAAQPATAQTKPIVISEARRPYLAKALTQWPFELFEYQDWLALDKKTQDDFENQIARAIVRARKTLSGT